MASTKAFWMRFSHWQWLNGTRIYPPLSREFTQTQFAKCSCDSSRRGLTLLLMLQDDNLQGKGEQTDRSNHILRATVRDKKQVWITTRVLTQSGLNYPPVGGLSTLLPNYTAGAEAFELLSCDLTRVQNQKVLSVPHCTDCIFISLDKYYFREQHPWPISPQYDLAA